MHITVFETNKRLYYSPEYIASTLSVMEVVLGVPYLDIYDEPLTEKELLFEYVILASIYDLKACWEEPCTT